LSDRVDADADDAGDTALNSSQKQLFVDAATEYGVRSFVRFV
jgi:hypothetical protein